MIQSHLIGNKRDSFTVNIEALLITVTVSLSTSITINPNANKESESMSARVTNIDSEIGSRGTNKHIAFTLTDNEVGLDIIPTIFKAKPYYEVDFNKQRRG